MIDCATLGHYWKKVDKSPLDYTGCTFRDMENGKETLKANRGHGPSMFVEKSGYGFSGYTVGELKIGTMKNSERHGLTIVVDGEQIQA